MGHDFTVMNSLHIFQVCIHSWITGNFILNSLYNLWYHICSTWKVLNSSNIHTHPPYSSLSSVKISTALWKPELCCVFCQANLNEFNKYSNCCVLVTWALLLSLLLPLFLNFNGQLKPLNILRVDNLALGKIEACDSIQWKWLSLSFSTLLISVLFLVSWTQLQCTLLIQGISRRSLITGSCLELTRCYRRGVGVLIDKGCLGPIKRGCKAGNVEATSGP